MNYEINEKKYIRTLKAIHSEHTKSFDLEDWRTVRTPYYWLADNMSEGEAWIHKIKLIEYYNKHGVPLK